MTGIHASLDDAGFRMLSHVLGLNAAEGLSGVLRVTGRPGGTFHLRRGLVVAVDSPGAPGPETLLTRSGRLRTTDRFAGDTVPNRSVGEAGLHVVRLMAALDATFAIIAGRMDDCVTHPQPYAGPARGEPAETLLREASRRLAALAALPRAVLPDRERLAAVVNPDGGALATDRREILRAADGRRSCRDIAFVLGRGVYSVTVQASSMLAEGQLTVVPDGSEPGLRARDTASPLRPLAASTPSPFEQSPASLYEQSSPSPFDPPEPPSGRPPRSVEAPPPNAFEPPPPRPVDPSGPAGSVVVSSALPKRRREAPEENDETEVHEPTWRDFLRFRGRARGTDY
ncbi:hypothetical protein [Actinomadura gamaensis]|uniref:MarR family transcriptional regulator n=1 Tax=Actinomadura gamaensis TaxID=1763541 RepID=A0ABV9TZW7_9ACTN